MVRIIFRYSFFVLSLFVFENNVYSFGPELSIQTGHKFKIKQLDFSKDGNVLGSLSTDNSILLWDTPSGRQMRQISKGNTTINAFAFHPDQKVISYLLEGKKIETLDYATGETQNAFKNDTAAYFRLFYIDEGKKIIVCDSNGIFMHANGFSTLLNSYITTKKETIQDVFVTDDGRKMYLLLRVKLAPLIFTNEIRCLNLSDLKISESFAAITLPCEGANDLSEFTVLNEQTIFMSEYQNMFKIDLTKKFWRLRSIYAVGEKKKLKIRSINAIRNKIYTGISNGDIQIYNPENNKYITTLKGHPSSVECISYHPSSKYIVTGDANGLILLWDSETNKLLRSFEGQSESISVFKFNTDQSKLVIGYVNGDIKYWDRLTQETYKINLQKDIQKARLGLNYAITDITAFKNDSIVEFECTYAFSIEQHTYDHLIYYKGIWHIFSEKLELIEIGTEFQMRFQISSPADYHKINYHRLNANPQLSDTADGLKVWTDGSSIVYEYNSITDTIFTSHQTAISVIKIINDRIVTAGWDGTIKEWDWKSKTEKMTYGICGRSGFFYYLPNGNYFTSKKALKFLSFRLGDKIFPFDQFDLVYNRPDVILDSIPFIEDDVVAQFRRAYEKRVSRSTIKFIDEKIIQDIPVVEISLPSLVVSNGKTEIKIKANDPKGKITELHVQINGVEIIVPDFTAAQSIEQDFEIELGYEVNNLVVFAENEKGLYSLKSEQNILNTQRIRKPDLYLITIGSGKFKDSKYDLEFASKDATDMKKYFSNVRMFDDVNQLHFTDEKVSGTVLNDIRTFIEPATENDHIILFYAGHGVLDEEYNYYLSVYEMDFDHPEKNGIDYLLLEQAINQSKARQKLLLIDACHSGEIDKEAVKDVKNETTIIKGKIKFRGSAQNTLMASGALELSKVLFTNTENKNGTAVISSSSGGEFAIEGEEWNNGLFTFVLLNGMKKKKADFNNDGAIIVSELQQYVNKTVYHLSGGAQTPNGRSENILNDFPIRK